MPTESRLQINDAAILEVQAADFSARACVEGTDARGFGDHGELLWSRRRHSSRIRWRSGRCWCRSLTLCKRHRANCEPESCDS